MTIRPVGLRARATIAFGLVGLFAAVALAVTTYVVARRYLLEQREESAERQGFANARLTRSALRSAGVDVASLLSTIRGESGSDLVVRHDGSWFASSVAVGRDSIPTGLRQLVDEDHAGRQLVRTESGGLQLVVGMPLSAVNGAYFEVFSLAELERTLDLLRNALIVGAAVTAIATAAVGRYAAGRVVRPLAPVTSAAARITDGDLQTRIPTHHDKDLAPLVDGFNTMAASLQQRIEREARFVSDVSHELRSPLAALRAGIEILDRRRASLPESVAETVDIMVDRIASFEELVLDLLEISRFDAGAVTLDRETLDVSVFIAQVLEHYGAGCARTQIEPSAPPNFRADRRRLASAFGNIIVNAARYAGGITSVTVSGERDDVVFAFDDAGPGVDPSERTAIFQRFARGDAGRRAGSSSGTGLGLALALAQIELHGGSITIDDAPGGGARFIVQLPVEVPR